MHARMVVAAATLALISPLTTGPAGSADGATLRTWQRLAMCESGGRWHLNTGNGYYGGLQFSGPTWRAYGGLRYARIASNASKRHQIRVAERVRRHQGWGAWPSCSRQVGLR
jgi:resuscitation-promoting factor RpfA